MISSMNFVLRFSRVALSGIALVLGSLGIFSLYASCFGMPLAAYAIVYLRNLCKTHPPMVVI